MKHLVEILKDAVLAPKHRAKGPAPLAQIASTRPERLREALSELPYPFVVPLPDPEVNKSLFKARVTDINVLGRAVYGKEAYSYKELEALCRVSPKSWCLAYDEDSGRAVGFIHVEPLKGRAVKRYFDPKKKKNEHDLKPQHVIKDDAVDKDTYIHIGSVVHDLWMGGASSRTARVTLQLLAGVIDRILTLQENARTAPRNVFTTDYPVMHKETRRACRNATGLMEKFQFQELMKDKDENPVCLLDIEDLEYTEFVTALVSLVNVKRGNNAGGNRRRLVISPGRIQFRDSDYDVKVSPQPRTLLRVLNDADGDWVPAQDLAATVLGTPLPTRKKGLGADVIESHYHHLAVIVGQGRTKLWELCRKAGIDVAGKKSLIELDDRNLVGGHYRLAIPQP